MDDNEVDHEGNSDRACCQGGQEGLQVCQEEA